jgi:hypothetical protein
MNLNKNLIWMFIGSLFIGTYLNGMNLLIYRFNDLYISKTLVYSALLMASNMCILEIIMHYNMTNKFMVNLFIIFIILSIMIVILLREQIFIEDGDWLKRMISHHSTALTTSHKIKNKTKNIKIKKLAIDIINTQEREIKLMKNLLNS